VDPTGSASGLHQIPTVMANAAWIAVSLKLGILFLPLASVMMAGILLLSSVAPPAHDHAVKRPPIHTVTRTP
jgi:hypothetical protein